MTAAKKIDWQTKPFPKATKELSYQRQFSQREIDKMKLGSIPEVMEDKWFIFFENDSLNFHRSWTGNKIYELNLAFSDNQYKATKAIINTDPTEYNQQDDAYDIKVLDFLIDRLLLKKDIIFK